MNETTFAAGGRRGGRRRRVRTPRLIVGEQIVRLSPLYAPDGAEVCRRGPGCLFLPFSSTTISHAPMPFMGNVVVRRLRHGHPGGRPLAASRQIVDFAIQATPIRSRGARRVSGGIRHRASTTAFTCDHEAQRTVDEDMRRMVDAGVSLQAFMAHRARSWCATTSLPRHGARPRPRTLGALTWSTPRRELATSSTCLVTRCAASLQHFPAVLTPLTRPEFV